MLAKRHQESGDIAQKALEDIPRNGLFLMCGKGEVLILRPVTMAEKGSAPPHNGSPENQKLRS